MAPLNITSVRFESVWPTPHSALPSCPPPASSVGARAQISREAKGACRVAGVTYPSVRPSEGCSSGLGKVVSRGSTTRYIEVSSSVLILRRLREGPSKARGRSGGLRVVAANRAANFQLAGLSEGLGEVTEPMDGPANILASCGGDAEWSDERLHQPQEVRAEVRLEEDLRGATKSTWMQSDEEYRSTRIRGCRVRGCRAMKSTGVLGYVDAEYLDAERGVMKSTGWRASETCGECA